MLDATLNNNSTNPSGDEWTGLQVREPSAVGIAKIKEFATKTGDIAVLSAADIRVLALAYDVEVEANGTWRLRDTLGAKRMGKDPEKKKARQLRKLLQQQDQVSLDAPVEDVHSQSSHPEAANLVSSELSSNSAADYSRSHEKLVKQTSQLTLEAAPKDSTSSETGAQEEPGDQQEAVNHVAGSHSALADSVEAASDIDWVKVPIKMGTKAPEEESDASSLVSASDPSWITPENVHIHQAKDMGFFPSLGSKPMVPKPAVTASGSSNIASENEQKHDGQYSEVNTLITPSTVGEGSSKPPTMKAAVLTGDYAMQNVALQIGLNVLGVGGKRIRDVKTFILRCYGCFKLCKDPTRKFCPTCGGATLTRVSITYTPSSPTGYILHLNPNFQYRNRGTVYSIPSAKPGSASFEKGGAKQRKGVNGASLVLREDQKEFQRGLKSVMIQKQKEERKLQNMEGSHSHALTSLSGWNDPDWEPAMFLGEKGRKSSGRGNHHSDSVRYGKDGLPVIGFGKNPNEVRRRGKR